MAFPFLCSFCLRPLRVLPYHCRQRSLSWSRLGVIASTYLSLLSSWRSPQAVLPLALRVVLQSYFFSVILCLFPSILPVVIGEDFIFPILVIFLLSDQHPYSSLKYNSYLLIFLQTCYSSTDSLMLASSFHYFSWWPTFPASTTFFNVLFFSFFVFLFMVRVCRFHSYKLCIYHLYFPFLICTIQVYFQSHPLIPPKSQEACHFILSSSVHL